MPIPSLQLQEKPVLQTNEQLSRFAFSNSGLEVGLPALQLPMLEICSTCLFQESLPDSLLGIPSIHFLYNRSLRLPRAAARSTISALRLHHAHPFVAAAGKTLSFLLFLFGNSEHPLSNRSLRLPRAAAHSSSSAL